jgi:hypothetical protein
VEDIFRLIQSIPSPKAEPFFPAESPARDSAVQWKENKITQSSNRKIVLGGLCARAAGVTKIETGINV